MNQGKLLIRVIVGLLIFGAFLIIGKKISEKIEFQQKQEELAALMNVSLKDYPRLPDDYFPKVLERGMPLEEVHKIMIGYVKVYYDFESDYSAFYEIYYYYSIDENKADRIQIIYDENYRITKIDQEDENSKTLTTEGWPEGQVKRR